MIYLVTGKPGEGKTLFTLWWVESVLRFMKDAAGNKVRRPVFYARVKGIGEKGVLDWQHIDPFRWFDAPAGSVVVIDEAQKADDPEDPKSPVLFGVRKRGEPPPIWAARLEDHRHGGVDLVIITQDPMLLDVHDRKLVGLHYHVMRAFGMEKATIHKFKGCKHDVERTRNGALEMLVWPYKREVYGWYTSAEAHTHSRHIPFKVWLAVGLPFVVVGIAWWAWQRLNPHKETEAPPSAVMAQSDAPGEAAGRAGKVMTPAEYLDAHKPRITGVHYSAPVYDEVTKPVHAPFPAACVVAESRPGKPCTCYTQQGTVLAVPDDMCRNVVSKGFFLAWNPAQSPGAYSPRMEQPAPEVAPAVVVSLGGGRPMGPAGGPVASPSRQDP